MLYHKEIGFPNTLVIPEMCLKLEYTKHALERTTKTSVPITKPSSALILIKDIVEVETKDDKTPIKIVLRTKYNNIYDLVLVLQPNYSTGYARVITLWLNDFRDTHKTLNKNLYDTPKVST